MIYEVAELDADGVIVGVREVGEANWVTDIGKRQVRLPLGHDMNMRLRTMRYDAYRGAFFPVVDAL